MPTSSDVVVAVLSSIVLTPNGQFLGSGNTAFSELHTLIFDKRAAQDRQALSENAITLDFGQNTVGWICLT